MEKFLPQISEQQLNFPKNLFLGSVCIEIYFPLILNLLIFFPSINLNFIFKKLVIN